MANRSRRSLGEALIDLKDVLEVGSDVVGAISAGLMTVPAYRLSKARRMLAERLAITRTVDPQDHLGLLKVLGDADQNLGSFDASDANKLKWGVWLLCASFLLKLAFHIAK